MAQLIVWVNLRKQSWLQALVKAELKRQKKFIKKQSDIIFALEKDIELKDNIILVLKNK